jgi:ArsR family transcriptional regulator
MKNLIRALRAMADEPRMTILCVLSIRGAVCVSHLQEAMKTPQPTVSRYLSILRNAGLLESERRGQWVYYSLNHDDDSLVIEMIQRASEQLKESTKIKRIMDRLDKLEQQPTLTEESVQTKPKIKAKPSKRANKRREKTVSEIGMEEAPVAEAAVNTTFEEKQTPEASEVVATTAPLQEQEANQIESVEVASAEQTAEVEGKKRTRKRKQQLPSLFDL